MNGIRLEVISKGRDLGDVLESYMKFYEDAKKVAISHGVTDESDLAASAMQGAAYRLYLLGVEDGMKEVQK